jgi:hypothetical protein
MSRQERCSSLSSTATLNGPGLLPARVDHPIVASDAIGHMPSVQAWITRTHLPNTNSHITRHTFATMPGITGAAV